MVKSQTCYNFCYNSPFTGKNKLAKAFTKNNNSLFPIFVIFYTSTPALT